MGRNVENVRKYEESHVALLLRLVYGSAWVKNLEAEGSLLILIIIVPPARLCRNLQQRRERNG